MTRIYDLEWQDEGHESSLLLPSRSTETTFDIPNTEVKRSRKVVIAGIALACLLFLGIYMRPGRKVLSSMVNFQQSLVTSLSLQAVEPEEELKGEISEEDYAAKFMSSSTLAYTADKIPQKLATSSASFAEKPTVKQPVASTTTSTFKARVASKLEAFYVEVPDTSARVASKLEAFYVKVPDTTAPEHVVSLPSDPTASAAAAAADSTAAVPTTTADAVVVPPVDNAITIPPAVALDSSKETPRLHQGLNCAFKMYKRAALYEVPAGCTIVASSAPENIMKERPMFGIAVCTSVSQGKFVVDDGRLYNVGLVDEDGTDKVRYVAPGADTKVYVTASMHMMVFESNSPLRQHQKYVKVDESEPVESIVFEATKDSAPASCDEVYDLLDVKESDRLTTSKL